MFSQLSRDRNLTNQSFVSKENELHSLASRRSTTAEHVDQVPGVPAQLKAAVLDLIGTGAGSTGWDATAGKEGKDKAGSSNGLWEGHHWKTIREVLNL